MPWYQALRRGGLLYLCATDARTAAGASNCASSGAIYGGNAAVCAGRRVLLPVARYDDIFTMAISGADIYGGAGKNGPVAALRGYGGVVGRTPLCCFGTRSEAGSSGCRATGRDQVRRGGADNEHAHSVRSLLCFRPGSSGNASGARVGVLPPTLLVRQGRLIAPVRVASYIFCTGWYQDVLY
eukprot:3731507-Rhodomonas_salina.3